jgi:hypothetical protein
MIKKYTLGLLFFALIFYGYGKAQEVKNMKAKAIEKLFQGAWFGAESDNAVFSVMGDTITYIDDFARFGYRITKDTFELQTTQLHYKELIIKLTPDSLVFKEVPSGEISRYWRNK